MAEWEEIAEKCEIDYVGCSSILKACVGHLHKADDGKYKLVLNDATGLNNGLMKYGRLQNPDMSPVMTHD